ncbi:MAG: hypothetical protein AAF212_01675 [Verrucomicrobiota bacterium]
MAHCEIDAHQRVGSSCDHANTTAINSASIVVPSEDVKVRVAAAAEISQVACKH